LFLPWKRKYQQSSWWVVFSKTWVLLYKPLTKFNMIFNPQEGRNNKKIDKKNLMLIQQPISTAFTFQTSLVLFMFE
jgi:hypothetical protein